MSKWDRKELVDSIIGNIPDFNFDDELELEPITDEEVAEIDRQYEEGLADGSIQPLTKEQDDRFRGFMEGLRTWYLYSAYQKSIGESFYDFQEWDNLVKKPFAPKEWVYE